jgi:hypothetical protein
MPELLEESIAEAKEQEQSAHVADTGEVSDSTLADETRSEPVIECLESSADISDKLEAPVLTDSASENAIVEEPVPALEEPVAVLEEPVADLEEPVADLEEPVAGLGESVADLGEPVAVLDEPSAAVPEETGTLDDEPGTEHTAFECTSEAPELADESIERPAIEEVADVLAAPIAEAADQCSVESATEAHAAAN